MASNDLENINKDISSSSHHGIPLPLNFRPGPCTVIVGRGKEPKENPGNIRLVAMAKTLLSKYKQDNKRMKTRVVSHILSQIYEANPCGGAFVKHAKDDGRWYEVSPSAARERVTYAFRDLNCDAYKSSSKSKVERRKSSKVSEIVGNGRRRNSSILFERRRRSSSKKIKKDEQANDAASSSSQCIGGSGGRTKYDDYHHQASSLSRNNIDIATTTNTMRRLFLGEGPNHQYNFSKIGGLRRSQSERLPTTTSTNHHLTSLKLVFEDTVSLPAFSSTTGHLFAATEDNNDNDQTSGGQQQAFVLCDEEDFDYESLLRAPILPEF